MSLLMCSELEFGYKTCLANKFDFLLEPGEIVALMGRNGSGKSTLLKTLCGNIPALTGSVEIQGRNIRDWSATELAKRVAYISVSKAAPDRMTVREFVSLGRMPYSGLFDGRTAEDERIIDNAISLMGLDQYANRNVSELSDGERTRVYLAEAVAQQVKVLLLDEPNAFLDIPWSHSLFKTLQQLAKGCNMGIVVSTHSLDYASLYSNRFIVVCGKDVHVGTLSEAQESGWLSWTNETV